MSGDVEITIETQAEETPPAIVIDSLPLQDAPSTESAVSKEVAITEAQTETVETIAEMVAEETVSEILSEQDAVTYAAAWELDECRTKLVILETQLAATNSALEALQTTIYNSAMLQTLPADSLISQPSEMSPEETVVEAEILAPSEGEESPVAKTPPAPERVRKHRFL
jgi:hypothetical protein